MLGWGLLSLGLVWPVINHLTGTTEDLSEYANLQGNLGMLAGLLLITWTVAAFGEELVYRGFIQTRVTDVLGAKLVGVVVAVVFTSVLFGLAHTEYGIVGVAVTSLDGLFLSVLRLRYRTLWASILAHGFWNTIGIVGLVLAPLFVLGSLEFVGPFEPGGWKACRRAGAAGLDWLVAVAARARCRLLVTA